MYLLHNEGGRLLTEMSHTAAFSAWLSQIKLPPLLLHPTLFLNESHLGLFSSHPACCETGCKCVSVTLVQVMADWYAWWATGVTGSASVWVRKESLWISIVACVLSLSSKRLAKETVVCPALSSKECGLWS